MNSFAPWHSISVRSVFTKLKTAAGGLVEREAKHRTQQFGANIVFRPTPPPPLWAVIASQIVSIPTLTFVVLAAVSTLALHLTLLGRVFLLLAVVQTVIAVILDERCRYVQEFIQSFAHSVTLVKRLRTPKARSEPQLRPVDQLVPGDIIVVSGGENIPADGRIIQSHDLSVDESTLTGESEHQEKSAVTLATTTPLLDRRNMVYTSSVVTKGRAVVAITATGVQTIVGSIAQSIPNHSKALLKNTGVSKSMSLPVVLIGIIGAIAVVILGVAQQWSQATVVLGVASVLIICAPYWQAIATTILEFEATRRLLRIGIVVKKHGVISRLGDVTTVCFDKTATLTKGSLSVEMILDSENHRFGSKKLNEAPEMMWAAVVLANDAMLLNTPGSRIPQRWVGDGTDCALSKSARVAGYDRERFLKRFPRVRSIPFDTSRKWMASVHRSGDSSWVVVKGAPERVLVHCKTRWRTQGKALPMSVAHRQTIEQEIATLAGAAKRVIGVASRRYRLAPGHTEDFFDLEWMGLFVLSDPLRDDARLSLSQLQQSYCRLVMLTGDHAANAKTISTQLGWDNDTVSGQQIEAMDDQTIQSLSGLQLVFARVEPRQKERIISLFQRRGDTVLMTGDGINDAYALQTADVGVAVANATDVARNAAPIVIGSDNLFSIVSALNEGRWVRVIQRLMSIIFAFQSALLVVGFLGLFVQQGTISVWQVVWIPVVSTTMIMATLLVLPARTVRFRPAWKALQWISGTAILAALLGAGVSTLVSQFFVDQMVARAAAWIFFSIVPIGLLFALLWKTPGRQRWFFLSAVLGVPLLLQSLVLSDPWGQAFFGVRSFPLWGWGMILLGLGCTTLIGWLFVRPLVAYDPHS